MAKFERRSIRIAGRVINSPRFVGKDARRRAEDWYNKKFTEKSFIEGGLMSSDAPTFMQYATKWIRRRMEKNPKATWQADEQRLRAYLLPALSEFPMNRITRTQMRDVLMRIQEEGGLSIETRTRIKALASKMFSDALNEDPPLIQLNPCNGLKFQDARQGKKKPVTLQDEDEVRAFLICAASVGRIPAMACALAVMAGLRKSELLALRYRNVSRRHGEIVVESHVEQATLEIKPGTKAGHDETREVTVGQSLLDMVDSYRAGAAHHRDGDFILCDDDGAWIRPRALHAMVTEVARLYGRPITLHKLRHTYGRLFVQRTGNSRALQDQLGHKSPTTTAIYSELSKEQRRRFSDVMNFEAPKLESKVKEVTPDCHQKKSRRG